MVLHHIIETHRPSLYYVNLAIQRIFGMNEKELYEFNDKCVSYSYLDLVKDKDDTGEGDDEYVKRYFKHDGNKWTLKIFSLSCVFYGAPDIHGTKMTRRVR